MNKLILVTPEGEIAIGGTKLYESKLLNDLRSGVGKGKELNFNDYPDIIVKDSANTRKLNLDRVVDVRYISQ